MLNHPLVVAVGVATQVDDYFTGAVNGDRETKPGPANLRHFASSL